MRLFIHQNVDGHLPWARSRGPGGRGQTQPLPLGARRLGGSGLLRWGGRSRGPGEVPSSDEVCVSVGPLCKGQGSHAHAALGRPELSLGFRRLCDQRKPPPLLPRQQPGRAFSVLHAPPHCTGSSSDSGQQTGSLKTAASVTQGGKEVGRLHHKQSLGPSSKCL